MLFLVTLFIQVLWSTSGGISAELDSWKSALNAHFAGTTSSAISLDPYLGASSTLDHGNKRQSRMVVRWVERHVRVLYTINHQRNVALITDRHDYHRVEEIYAGAGAHEHALLVVEMVSNIREADVKLNSLIWCQCLPVSMVSSHFESNSGVTYNVSTISWIWCCE